MAGEDAIAIIGAGPAGAAAASVLAGKGFEVRVFEANRRLGAKPCGKGIPSIGDLPVRIPRDSVVRRIKGAVLYVNGSLAFDVEEGLEGVIVDKERMLEAIIVESGADLVRGAVFKPSKGVVRIGARYVEAKRGLLAGGHSFYPGETINAIQYRLKSPAFESLDKLLIYFDTWLIGYYYIFPGPSNEADVGVGGFAGFNDLQVLLDKFIKSSEYTKNAVILRREGARIAVGGVKLGTTGGLPRIGEAAGFVLPLTGEGIRPSMISGAVAAEALASGRDPRDSMDKSSIARGVRVQRRILEKVKAMAPEKRAKLLKSIPAEAHAMIALGKIDRRSLARVLARHPRLLARIISLL